RQVPFERRTVAEVIEQEYARVVDEDVEGPDLRGGRPHLPLAGDVQLQWRDPRVLVGVWLPGPGGHPGRAAAQGLGDQRLTDSPVGPGYQNGLAVDRRAHRCFLLEVSGSWPAPPCSGARFAPPSVARYGICGCRVRT